MISARLRNAHEMPTRPETSGLFTDALLGRALRRADRAFATWRHGDMTHFRRRTLSRIEATTGMILLTPHHAMTAVGRASMTGRI